MIPKPLLTALVVLISLAFAANVIIGYVDPPRAVPAINTIFGAALGALFMSGQKDNAVAVIKSLQGRRGQSKKDEGGDQS